MELYCLLKDKGYNISVLTIFCAADQLSAGHLGGNAYCQHIRERNKEKQLAWAREHLHDTFDDVT